MKLTADSGIVFVFRVPLFTMKMIPHNLVRDHFHIMGDLNTGPAAMVSDRLYESCNGMNAGRGLAPAASRQLRIRLASGEFVPFYRRLGAPKGISFGHKPPPCVDNSALNDSLPQGWFLSD